MSSETLPTLLATPGVCGETRGKAITDKDLKFISEQLLHFLGAAPRILRSIGQCSAIAWSDSIGDIAQESDAELYAKIGLPTKLAWSRANSILPDPNFSKPTSSNVLTSDERCSDKLGTACSRYQQPFGISSGLVVVEYEPRAGISRP